MAKCIVTLEETSERCGNVSFEGTDYCGRHGEWFRADLEVFREISEHFRMDVHEYWSRTNFYLLVQGALVSVFIGIVRGEPPLGALSLIVGVFGLLLGLYWFLVAWESVKWIDRWREMTIFMDARIDRFACCGVVERQRGRISSPEKATSLIPLLFAVGWGCLLIWGRA